MHQTLLQRAFGLKPYSEDLSERLTGRATLSLALVEQQPESGRVLDVGCSDGWLERSLFGKKHRTITGIEPDRHVIDQARSLFPAGDFRVASVLSLPFEEETFDGAVMFEVIEHVPRGTELEALREIRRVLRPGAWFLLSTPFANPAAILLDPAWYFGHRHYSDKDLRSLFRSAGFCAEETFVRGAWWELFGVISLYFFKWVFKSETPFKKQIEKGRAHEFLDSNDGISNIFVLARAFEPK